MAQRNFTDSEEAEIAKLYTVGGFGIKQIKRAYRYKHHISFSHALKRQGIAIRSNHENNRLYDLNPHVFDVIDNELAAYWLGFIYADGHVSKRTLTVVLSIKDEATIKKLKRFMQSESPVQHTTTTVKGKIYNRVGISFTDIHLAERLKDLGIITNRGKFDRCISQVKPNMIQHWIRGLVDGDGSFHSYKPGFSIVGRKSMLEFIRKVFADEIGRNPNIKIYKHPTAKIHSLVYMGRPQCQIIAEYLYNNATIWMPRKRDIVENYPTPIKRKRNSKGQYK